MRAIRVASRSSATRCICRTTVRRYPRRCCAFLAYYERDGVLVGVVGGGMAGKVMKVRGKIAAGAPIAEVLDQTQA